MCGIVGYVGEREATPLLLDGLRRLEYRGYDSAGIAVVGDDGEVRVARSEGKLGNLTEKIAGAPPPGHFGVGHTRWATHGRPSEENAHPHRDASGRIVVIHNGIIENFLPLKQRLQREGVTFLSETDTEVVAHALAAAWRAAPGKPFAEIVRETAASLKGMYALVLFSADEPGVLYALKWGPPIVLGLGDGENFVASDATALLPHTREPDLPRGRGSRPCHGGGCHRDRLRRRAPGAAGPRRPVGRRLGRKRRLPALHGQGDCRAADGRDRDDRGEALPRDGLLQRGGDGCPASASSRDRPHPDRRLRDELARGTRREIPPRGDRAPPDGRRLRVRVPVPRPSRGRAHARPRDLAVGRDGRHGRGPQGGEGARRPDRRRRERAGLGDRAPRGRRPRDARGARGRRRLDEGVHDAARRARPLRALREGRAHGERRRPSTRNSSRRSRASPRRSARRSGSNPRSRSCRPASRGSPTRSSSVAARTTRSRSRAP